MAKPARLFKVTFLNQGRVYELYARRVGASDVLGFTEIAELVFEPGGLVVDPTEERLRDEFRDTRVLHLPMHAVLRIEEVDRRSPLAIRDAATGEKIMPFPISRPRDA
ncbi:MAG: DUF1820 family protein [Lysobacterales bacterium]